MGLQTSSFTPTSSGVARYNKAGQSIPSNYTPNGASRFVYRFCGGGAFNYFEWDQNWAVITIKTDAAGCASLSWSAPGDKYSYSKIQWKVSTSADRTTSGLVDCSFSNNTWSGSWNSGLIANTTYYAIIYATTPSLTTNNGDHVTGCWGTLTFTATGTYGKPGEITANNTTFASPINMSYGSATSGGTYTVKVKLGTNAEVTLQTKGSATSQSWTPGLSTYASSYPNQASVNCVITVDTYFGSQLAGTKTKTVTVSFTAAQVAPEIAAGVFSIAPRNTGTIEGLTGYIQNYSKIRASYNSSGVTLKYGASVAKWTVKFGSDAAVDVAAGTATKDSGAISEDTTVVCTVVDSRGFTASATFTATITPYQKPTLRAATFRCDSEGNADDAGTHVSVSLTAIYADVAGQNTLTTQALTKLASAQSYGTAVPITGGTTTQSGTNKTRKVTAFRISGFSDNVFDVLIRVTDALGNTAEVRTVVPSQAWAIHFRNKGAGAAFGKAAERDSELDIGNWILRANGILSEAISLESGTDLNDVSESGIYKANSSTITDSLSNCPHSGAGMLLIVCRYSTDNYLRRTQIIFSSQYIYVRIKNTTGWSSWYVFAGTAV